MMWVTGITRNFLRGFIKAFSLLELMVVILLIGIFTAVMVPTFNSITGARLKSTANQLQGLIKDSYNRAALSGKTCRIVFDIDQKEYWVEEASDLFRHKTQEDQEEEEKLMRDAPSAAENLKNPEFKAVEDKLGEKTKLPEDVYFKSIWVDTFEERLTSGEISLYFFPDGYTEKAQIVISDDPKGERLFDLIVEPLTGRVVIEDHEVPIEME